MWSSLRKLAAFLRPRRRWFQYSLRTLLLLATVFAIWLGFYVHRVNRQRDAVAAIRELGGWIRYDYQISNGKFDPNAQSSIPIWLLRLVGEDYFHDVVEVNLVYNDDGPQRLDNPVVTDEALKSLGGFPKLKVLYLYDTQATDQGLEHVGRLKHLERLFMWDASEVSDTGVQHLRNLSQLKYLHINNSNITDDALRIFGGLPRLEGLSLQGNCFTDRGLKSLRRLTRLQSLSIGTGDTRITDEGLLHLHGLKNLSQLEIQGSPVTQAGIAKLQQALPRISVMHEITDIPRRPVPRTASVEGDGPHLRFLSWDFNIPRDSNEPIEGAFWYPDGTPIREQVRLEPLRWLGGHSPPGAREGYKYLCLFVSDQRFSDGPYGHVELLDSRAEKVLSKGRCFSSRHAMPQKDLTGWLRFSPETRPGDLPDAGTVRLHYTVGEWHELAAFPTDTRIGEIIADHALLWGIGETGYGVAFVTVSMDPRRDQDIELQYRVLARDAKGRRLPSKGRLGGPAGSRGRLLYTFKFQCPLLSVDTFTLEAREIQTVEFRNVALRPGHATQPKRVQIDERPQRTNQ